MKSVKSAAHFSVPRVVNASPFITLKYEIYKFTVYNCVYVFIDGLVRRWQTGVGFF